MEDTIIETGKEITVFENGESESAVIKSKRVKIQDIVTYAYRCNLVPAYITSEKDYVYFLYQAIGYGFDPYSAAKYFYLVTNRDGSKSLNLYTEGMAAIFRSKGGSYNILKNGERIETNGKPDLLTELQFTMGQESFHYSKTWSDIQLSGLAGKEVYQKYPKWMLLKKCLAEGLRFYFPHLFAGLRSLVEDYGYDENITSDIIETEFTA
jgi:hypothetical protein